MELNKLSLNLGVWVAVIVSAVGVAYVVRIDDAIRDVDHSGGDKGGRNGVAIAKLTEGGPQTDCLQNGVIGYVEVPKKGICWKTVPPSPISRAPAFHVEFDPSKCPPFANGCVYHSDDGKQKCSGDVSPGGSGKTYEYDTFTIGTPATPNFVVCGKTAHRVGGNGIILDH